MFSYIWPIGLVVICNTFYQICSKSVPSKMNPFISLTLTYLVAAAVSLILFFCVTPGENPIREIGKTNWAPFLLGVVIVGLEAGFLFAYKAGWQVSMASLVQSAILAVVLLFVGYFAYHETLSVQKLVGGGIILVGLFVINR